MLEILTRLVNAGLLGFVGYIVWCFSKIIVTAMICKPPELSDEKVKYITRMIAKDKNKTN